MACADPRLSGGELAAFAAAVETGTARAAADDRPAIDDRRVAIREAIRVDDQRDQPARRRGSRLAQRVASDEVAGVQRESRPA